MLGLARPMLKPQEFITLVPVADRRVGSQQQGRDPVPDKHGRYVLMAHQEPMLGEARRRPSPDRPCAGGPTPTVRAPNCCRYCQGTRRGLWPGRVRNLRVAGAAGAGARPQH